MKRLLTLIILSIAFMLTGCVDQYTNLEVVYKLDKTASHTSYQVYENLNEKHENGLVYIVLKDDFNLDKYKDMINDNMTSEEVDRIIELSRQYAKDHFKSYNESFIETYQLNDLSGDVRYSSYGPFITIYYASLNISEIEIDKLIYLSIFV